MFSASAYYLCTSGEVKKLANEHRAAHIRLKKELWAFVESMGCKSASIDERLMRLRGVVFPSEVPSGWTKLNKHKLSCPQRYNKDPDILRYFVQRMPTIPEEPAELAKFHTWLNCPLGYHYTHKTGNGWSRIGGFYGVRLYWYSATSPIMLEVPDVKNAKAQAHHAGYTVKNNVLDWKLPKGCKEIMVEEWQLMVAKHKKKKHANKERTS